MASVPEFIPQAGACRIMSHIDTSEYLNGADSWRITDFNEACAIEPALIGIYDFPVGSDRVES